MLLLRRHDPLGLNDERSCCVKLLFLVYGSNGSVTSLPLMKPVEF